MLKFILILLSLLLSSPAFGAITVNITTPATESFSTSASTIDIIGSVTSTTGWVNRLVWDNIRTDIADIQLGSPGAASPYNFTISNVALKPGINEILLTGTSSSLEIGTDKVYITRTVSGPSISNISVNASTLRVYEKYEITFDLDTCATNPTWTYDESTPAGITSAVGVNVYATFSKGIITKTQPAFYNEGVTLTGDWWDGRYVRNGTNNWKVRFSPTEAGSYVVTLHAKDACGETSAVVGILIATLPNTDGFVEVSSADGRYFQYSSGKIFWPTGPVDILGDGYASYTGSGTNLARPWMGGHRAFSTRWSTWVRTDDNPSANEGASQPLTHYDKYPSSDLSRVIKAGTGCGVWLPGNWFGLTYGQYNPQLTVGLNYLVKLRLKTTGIVKAGTWGTPNYGLVLKQHDFLVGIEDACTATGFYSDLISDVTYPLMLDRRVTADTDWHTIIFIYTPTANRDHMSLYLEDCSAGTVYIDQLSIKRYYGGGVYGPELMYHSRSDVHTYIETPPAVFFERQLAAAESAGVFLKWGIYDKNDWVPNHLDYATGKWTYSGRPTANGTTTQMICTDLQDPDGYYNGMTLTVLFRPSGATYQRTVLSYTKATGVVTIPADNPFPYVIGTDDDFSFGSGFTQGSGSPEGKFRYLLKQWWDELAARYGYSPAVHSFELSNEENPGIDAPRLMINEFGTYMHDTTRFANPHMVSISFWSGYNSTLYNDQVTYPEVDYADVHYYRPHGYFSQDDDDMALFMMNVMTNVVVPEQTAIPVIFGEIGITGCDGPNDPPAVCGDDPYVPDFRLAGANDAVKTIMYHNAVWVTLHPRAGYLGQYWWPFDHLPASFWNVSTPFKTFISSTDLHKGGYVDANAKSSLGTLVYGRKNIAKRKAVLWLRNNDYNWYYCWNNGVFRNPPARSGTITLTEMGNSIYYIVERWNTSTGVIQSYTTAQSAVDGTLIFSYSSIVTDAAYKVYPSEWRTASYNNRRTSVNPITIPSTGNLYDISSWSLLWSRYFSTDVPTVTRENISNVTQFITGGSYGYIGTMGRGGQIAGGRIHGINLATGADIWTYSNVTGGFMHALVYDDYAGGTVFGATTYGEIVAVSASDGTERWPKYLTGRPGGFSTAPLIENDTLIVTGRDGYVYALNLNGTLKWEKNIGVPIQNSPAADGGIVYFVDERLIAHALYVSSGEYVSGWPSVQFYGGSAKDYWPVLTDNYMMFTVAGGQQRDFLSIESQLGCDRGALISACTSGNEVPSTGFQSWLTGTNPWVQALYILNRNTGLKQVTSVVTYTGGSGSSHPPPIVLVNGNVVVEYRAPCSWWDYWWTYPFSAMGYLNPTTGLITSQIVPTNVDAENKVPWGYWWIIGDETAVFSATSNLLFCSPQSAWGGYEFSSGMTFGSQGQCYDVPYTPHPVFGGRDCFGPGTSEPVSWYRQEWNGAGRNVISIGGTTLYYLIGGRIFAIRAS